MKLLKIILPVLIISFLLGSCKKYLDLKPDQSLYVPSTLTDCQGLLDNYIVMNSSYPANGEAAADNYFLTDASWSILPTAEARDNYIWAAQGNHLTTAWSGPYAAIFNSNLVLQVLDKITPASGTTYNSIKGSALFFRGFSLHTIASLFCKPYDPTSSSQDLGVPVRLSPNIDIVYGRGTVQQVYERIILDLKNATQLLPTSTSIKSRPNKTAAYAALSRVYLSMRDYGNAGLYADSCLKSYNTLLNYSSLPTSPTSLFTRFNNEVIFPSIMTGGSSSIAPVVAKVVKTLYDSYDPNDLRKVLFFRANTGVNIGTFAFKGSYDGSAANPFNGLATDEIYLIRAECYARSGKITEALKDLNDLLRTRWKVTMVNGVNTTPYPNYTAGTADEALNIILNERRKELIFRGIRWTDLRRLNTETRFAITLTRTVNGNAYSLPPNDLRYTMLIPQDVINTTGIPQNAR